jgi:hypothetical protein
MRSAALLGLGIQGNKQSDHFPKVGAPTMRVGTILNLVLKIPPRSEAAGIVPQTIVLIVAFILP